MAGIRFSDVSKVYPDGTRALEHVSLSIPDGAFGVLIGPSGCGKTSLLRMTAGLESITEGIVEIGDREVNGLPPRERDVAMVFQNYALYPHMSIAGNLGFSLKLRGVKKVEIASRVRDVARLLQLTEFLEKKPRHLSGGQRQRVAMGRAIIREPVAFLMDEPLSNLDAKLRVEMRAELASLQRTFGTTTIFVTHDQMEAMTLGDIVAVMDKGEVQQIGTPQELFEQPANIFVAGFLGSPGMNLLEGMVTQRGNEIEATVGTTTFPIEGPSKMQTALQPYVGRAVIVGIRPEDFGEPTSNLSANCVSARVEICEIMGREMYLHFHVNGAVDSGLARREDIVAADVAPEDAGLLSKRCVARVSCSTPVREGDTVALSLNPALIHFFDSESGVAIQ